MKKTVLLLTLLFLILPGVHGQDGEQTPEATEPSDSTVSSAPIFTVEQDGIFLDVYFNTLKQGRVGLLGLRGDDIVGARTNLFLKNYDFYQIDGREGWWTLIAASMEQTIRPYELIVEVERDGEDEPTTIATRFDLISGRFIRQEVNLIPEEATLRLLEPEVEAQEFDTIFGITAQTAPEVFWDSDSFIAPLNAELTSPFGAARVFNETLQTIHTGWDFNAPTGTPLVATANGQVAFAGDLDIRGKYVLVDHGRGVYSGYAHMSVIYVTQGQQVYEGQVLGLVGSTGRSSSAHAHFEMIVADTWVDAADFVRMYVP